MKPFRFGVSVRGAASRAEWSKKAKKAEDLGYSTFLVADHLAEMFPPLIGLVAAADATTTLRVGTFVVNNDLHHPVVLARETATVDLLADGRFELGIGAGHMQNEYEEAGIPFDSGGTRVDRLGESVAIIKALWSGQDVSFQGDYYSVSSHRIFPIPVQRPGPPLLIGGNGRRLLSLAAREADIVGLVGFSHRKGGREVDLSTFTARATKDQVERIRRDTGDRFERLELNALVQDVIVTTDRDKGIERLTPELPGLTPEDVSTSPYLLIGRVEVVVE